MKRPWSFVLCDKKYCFLLAFLLLITGVLISLFYGDPNFVTRFGYLIVPIGVWMSMRDTFRNGLSKYHNVLDSSPTLPGKPGDKAVAVNGVYFNNLTFQYGDAWLRIYGLIIVIVGTVIGAFGDLILLQIFSPHSFAHTGEIVREKLGVVLAALFSGGSVMALMSVTGKKLSRLWNSRLPRNENKFFKTLKRLGGETKNFREVGESCGFSSEISDEIVEYLRRKNKIEKGLTMWSIKIKNVEKR